MTGAIISSTAGASIPVLSQLISSFDKYPLVGSNGIHPMPLRYASGHTWALFAGTKYAIEVDNEKMEEDMEDGVSPLFKYILEERDKFKEENIQYKEIIKKLEEENKHLQDLRKKESLAS